MRRLNIPPKHKAVADGSDDTFSMPDLIKAFGAPNPFKVSIEPTAYRTLVVY